MGLDLDHVISHSRHHGAFICAICQRLTDLDCLVTTGCSSHCFCKQCLQEWLDTNKTTCPTCNRDLLYSNKNNHDNNNINTNSGQQLLTMMMGSQTVMVQPLERAQPLAHRLLKSIAVKCPMRNDVGCQWEGDYGDLQTHLLSSTAHNGDYATTSSSSRNDIRSQPMELSPTTATASPCDNDDAGGDDDELMSSSTSLLRASSQKKKQLSLATSLKAEANGQFETKHYREANSLYTKAISVLENVEICNVGAENQDADNNDEDSANITSLLTTLHSNRAATNLKLQEYNLCLDDCNYILRKLDTSNVKVYVRAIRASVQLGQLEMATSFVKRALQQQQQQQQQQQGGSNNSSILHKEERHLEILSNWKDEGNNQLKNRQFAYAKTAWSNLLKEAPSAIAFLLGAAKSDLGLGLTDSALRLTKRILVQHAQNPQGCWVRGQVLFLMGEYKLGVQLVQEALRLDPDSSEIKQTFKMIKKVKEHIETAQQKMFSRQFAETVESLTAGIQQYQPPIPPKAPLYATLHTQRAQAHLRLKQYKETLKDCALVLYAQEDHVPAWLVRIQAHHGLRDHETALDEARDVSSKFPQDERLRKAHEHADFCVRRERRPDYYALLGCSSIASEMEIKKAYKVKALELHPDRLPPGSSGERTREAQRQFQLLGEGLEILCDDFMRKLYDEGYDSEAIRQRVEAAKQAARRHGGGYH